MLYENVYSIPVLLALFLFIGIVKYLLEYRRYRTKLRKSGPWPPLVPYYIPFGFDTIWKNIQVAFSHGCSESQYNRKNDDFGFIREHMKLTGATTYQAFVAIFIADSRFVCRDNGSS